MFKTTLTSCSRNVSRVLRTLLVLVFLFVAFLVAGASLVAQEVEYKAWQLDDTLAGQEQAVLASLQSGTVTDRQQLDRFFSLYYFPRWTDPANAASLARLSADFLREAAGKATGPARAYILSTSFDQLSKMAADGTVHPPARINAMLAIGKLIEQPAAAGSGELDKPYPSALPYLMKECERADNPEWLRLASLLGIVRHSFLGVADDSLRKEKLPGFLRTMLVNRKPAALDSAEEREIKDWFRLRAIEAIQGLRTTGDRGETVESLLAILEDTNESFEVRYAATRVLGDLPLKASADAGIEINPDRITSALFLVTRTLCSDEVAFIDSLYTKSAVGSGRGASMMGGGLGGGMMGGGMMLGGSSGLGSGSGTSTPRDVEQSVARLKLAICSLLNGFNGSRTSKISPYTDSVGALPLVPTTNTVHQRITNTTKLLEQFLVFLDDGPKTLTGTAGGMGASMSASSGGGGSGTGRPGQPGQNTGPTFNVTLGDIRFELLNLAKLLSEAAMTR